MEYKDIKLQTNDYLPRTSSGSLFMDLPDDVDVEMKITHVTNSSLQSTRNMLEMCDEGQRLGVNIITYGEVNDEQLSRLEEGMKHIKDGVYEADQSLDVLEEQEYCCGLMTRRRPKLQGVRDTGWSASGDKEVVSKDNITYEDNRAKQSISGNFIHRITDDSREDEMESNLAEIDGIVGNLKHMAIDIGNGLSHQNRQINRINEEAMENQVQLTNVNKHADQILND